MAFRAVSVKPALSVGARTKRGVLVSVPVVVPVEE